MDVPPSQTEKEAGKQPGSSVTRAPAISEIVTLEDQIASLTTLYTRVQNLRQLPGSIQKPRDAFAELHAVEESLHSKELQEALRRARDSAQNNGTGFFPALERREQRKRGRPVTPQTPTPYIGEEISKASREENHRTLRPEERVDKSGLEIYVQNFNETHSARLHIWAQTRDAEGRKGTGSMVLRCMLVDVLTAYIVVGNTAQKGLVAESVSVFGPREGKAPHSESDYGVFRLVSQEVGKRVSGGMGVAGAVELLCAYVGLFVERCVGCGRVVSAEGHVPAVVREWDGQSESWTARHVQCR